MVTTRPRVAVSASAGRTACVPPVRLGSVGYMPAERENDEPHLGMCSHQTRLSSSRAWRGFGSRLVLEFGFGFGFGLELGLGLGLGLWLGLGLGLG